MNHQELLQIAYKAQSFAYAPYSNFMVGAALLSKSGKAYLGCNIENAAFSPTNCAERTAFFKAVSEGETDFVAVAIVGNGRDATEQQKTFCAPCGVCRQVMMEFCDPNTFEIILGNGSSDTKVYTLAELLPQGFSGKELHTH